MTAQLFIVYPHDQSWVRAPYYGSTEHVMQLRLAVDEAIEREQQLEEMKTDVHIDLQNAVKERITLQRMLWELWK